MKTRQIIAHAVLIVGCSLALHGASAQQPETKRINLQQHDLSAPGREVVQVIVEFPPGSMVGRHTHPGEEIVYVLEGSLEYDVDGNPPMTLKAGDVFFVPAGTVHAAKNVSKEGARELATYVVEKGKPLLTEAK